MCREEPTGRVCAIDFEAFIWTREFLDENEIVKGGRDIEKLRGDERRLYGGNLAACGNL